MLSTIWSWVPAGRQERVLFAISAVLFLSGLVHLGVQVVVGGPWSGPVSWRKPVTFGLSFGLTLATVTWVTSLVRVDPSLRRRLLGVFAVACVTEVAVITVQAWRHVPSHFNLTTPVNATLAFTAAGGGAVIILVTVLFVLAAVRGGPPDPVQELAVRVGLGTFLLTLAVGAVMIAKGVVTARTVSQTAAYSAATGLKPAHAVLMHGVLVLPVLARLATVPRRPPAWRARWVAAGCAGYLLLAAAVLVDGLVHVLASSAAGVAVRPASLVAGSVGALVLLAAGGVVLAGCATARRHREVPGTASV